MLQRRRKTRGLQGRTQYSKPNKEVGTIDDKTGNYRRAPGTIDDSKKTHETKGKFTQKQRLRGHCRAPTWNNYRRRFGPRLWAPPLLEKRACLATRPVLRLLLKKIILRKNESGAGAQLSKGPLAPIPRPGAAAVFAHG